MRRFFLCLLLINIAVLGAACSKSESATNSQKQTTDKVKAAPKQEAPKSAIQKEYSDYTEACETEINEVCVDEMDQRRLCIRKNMNSISTECRKQYMAAELARRR